MRVAGRTRKDWGGVGSKSWGCSEGLEVLGCRAGKGNCSEGLGGLGGGLDNREA